MTTLKLVGVAVLCGIFTGIRGGLFSVAMWRLNVRIRTTLFSSLLTQELGFFDMQQTGGWLCGCFMQSVWGGFKEACEHADVLYSLDCEVSKRVTAGMWDACIGMCAVHILNDCCCCCCCALQERSPAACLLTPQLSVTA
jgi:hypothetical protein